MNWLNKNISLLTILIVALTLLISCKEDGALKNEVISPLKFLGIVETDDELSTRALAAENITYEEFPTPIYIKMQAGETEKSGVYEVKSGYDGRLASKEESDELNWIDSDSGHTFFGWTMPWKIDDNIISEEPETVYFTESYYENLGFKKEEYYNCAILEKFIGTKEGPIDYRHNGEYVELQFQHLVSKIYISNINLTTNDGSAFQNVSGEMTIYHLPNKGYFYRQPEDGKAPYVLNPSFKDEVLEEDFSDVTYNVAEGAALYICPKVNFKDLQFKISLTWPPQHSSEGDYYGDFSSVKFIRHPNTDEWDKDKTEEYASTTLYAGEMIYLNLTLRQGNVTGVTANIGKWSDKNSGISSNYPHPGIYTDVQLADLLLNGKSFEDLYSIYGEDENSDKVFHIYNDLDFTGNNLEIPEGYILDGMGHTITVSSLDNLHYENVRDIYITDGTTTIYIDSNGDKFKVQDDGSLINSTGL